jgi:ferredoxin
MENQRHENLPGISRKKFLTLGALFALATTAKAAKVDGGLAPIQAKKAPKRGTSIVPPGAWSLRNFSRHCTACGLCISECPNQVLRPSEDPARLMQPELSYERGFCRPECTRCSHLCPTGAIHPITRAEKSATQIGHAVWIKENCVVTRDGVHCGNCARHCPAGAIHMVPLDAANEHSPLFPVVNPERCIGCGACEYVCPARPLSAIYVEGNQAHRTV